jgi:sugar lactone lactonase YvrE
MAGEFKSIFARISGLCCLALFVQLMSAAPALAAPPAPGPAPTDCIITLPAAPVSGQIYYSVVGQSIGTSLTMVAQLNAAANFAVGDGVGADTASDCDGFNFGIGNQNGVNTNPGIEPPAFTTPKSASTSGATYTFTPLSCDASASVPDCLTDQPASAGCTTSVCQDAAFAYSITIASLPSGGFNGATSDAVTIYFDPTGYTDPTTSDAVYYQPLTINITLQTPIPATTTSVTSSLNPATAGQTETFTATVSSSSTVNEGTVAFSSDGSTISGCGTQPVSSGVATCPASLAAGSHPIVASYAGDTNFAASDSGTSLTQTVNAAPTATRQIPAVALTQGQAATGFKPVLGGSGTTPLTYSSPNLPANLSIDSTSGVITGTATAVLAATAITVKVTDSNGIQAQNTFQLTVNPAVSASPGAAVTLTQNHAASFTPVAVSGGTAPLTYSAPALPAGLSIDNAGLVSGTPTVTLAATPITVTATDANGASASNSFTLTVNTAVTAMQTHGTVTLTQGHANPVTPVTGGGGTGTLTYSISGVTLPSGLTFNSAGLLSGAPGAPLTATTATVTVTDTNGATASNSFILTVNAPVTAPSAGAAVALTEGHTVTPFTPVAVSGGTAPFTYSAPALPLGLSIDNAGVVSGTPGATLSATSITVTATDVNGSTASNSFLLTVNPALTATQQQSTVILTEGHANPVIPVTGVGGTPTLVYSISTVPPLPSGLIFNTGTGNLSGPPGATLAATTFTVTVTDANNATAFSTFSLTVNPSVTASAGSPTVGLTQNHAVTSFTPVTAAGGTGSYTYSIGTTLPNGLTFHPDGSITGTPTATLTATSFTVTATDGNGATGTANFTLTVNAPPAAATAQAAVILTQGHSNPVTPVTGSSGTAPLSYSATLPAGLTIDPTLGVISGSPTGTQTATSVTVTVTDANGVTANASFTLTINPAVTASTAVATTSLTEGHAATAFTPVTGGGGTAPLSYSVSTSLPAGLLLDSVHGSISSTPTATLGTTLFTMIVTDANGATASATFSLTVNAAPTATVAVSQAFLTESFAVTPFTPIQGAGGTAPLSYSIQPTLPAGLTFSSAGVVGGTPSAAATVQTYTVTVTDANGATATTNNTFQLTVNGPVTATLAVASKGLTVNFAATPFTPVTGAGGTGTLSYSVSPTLPAGIALSPTTGQVTGLPTNPVSATNYTVTVTDGIGATASKIFSLAVNGSVTASTALATTTLTENHANPSFVPVTGGGGTTPYAYTISPALPAGLSLSSTTGAITGAPSVTSAAMSYTVTVTDANGATAQANFSLTVNTAVTATQAVAMTSLKVHQLATAFTPVTGGGGTGLLGYSVSPSLPAGLSVDSTTGTISGTPTVTQAATPYTVTVADANGATATASFSLAVTTTTSSVAVTTSVNPSNYGQSVTFTAAVSGAGAAPTGTVTFKDGGTTLFTGTLVNQLTSYSTSTLAPGPHAISVAYSGDSGFAGSSGGLTQIVGGAATTPGQAYPYQGTLTGFGGPGGGIFDPVNDHILICDTGNDRVEVLNAQTLATVAIIGVTGVAGSDNAHFSDPIGVAFDGATNRIFVADTGNNRIQVFNAASFAYVETIGAQLTSDGRLVAAAGNTAFAAPGGLHVDSAAGRLYVADTGNQRVQIFETATLAYVGTLGTSGVSGSDNAHFNAPKDVVVNTAAGEILVADSGNSRVQRFDAVTFAYKGTIGGPGLNVGDSDYLGAPNAVAFDPLSNLVLIADSTEERVEVFDALSYTYVLTLGTTGSAGSSNSQFFGPDGVVVDTVHERIFVADQRNNRLQMFSIAPTVAFASVLPGSRSVELGKPATIFASLINAGTTALQGCQVALPVTAPSGLTLSYQTTDPATNGLTGAPDTPATIPAKNGVQSFLVTLQGAQAFSAPGMALDFGCLGIGPAAVVTGVDTVDLAMATAPVADVIALAATISNNGIAEIPAGGTSAFAVATSNVGATSEIVASVDTGSATLPLTATLCQSNSSTGACLATPASSVLLTDTAGAAPTFSVFLQATGTIPFAPATSRVFVRFKDPAGGIHGSTSVAVETK